MSLTSGARLGVDDVTAQIGEGPDCAKRGSMSLTVGMRLGQYEVVAPLGAGGMGQVFRARDTKLNREVALKILPDLFANDPDRLARFTREAQTLAALNHPHIAAIYGLEERGGVRALVMELVEGDDLSQRIARGAIPVDEALPIAKQIAEALEAAHEHGIIHRDLKPANIKVRGDGTVKVLDFGLAKAMEPASAQGASAGQAHASMSPTITTPAMTQAGMILGTAAYMSPEQARGKTVDKRADIWAFGAVLFEMLTGTRAFPGEDLTDTLAAVVKLDPTWDAVGADVPARVRQVLRVCLQKDPRQRAHDIADIRLALEGAFEATAPPTVAPATAPRGRLAWMAVSAVAAVLAAALAIPAVRHLREPPPSSPPETRLDIVTPAADDSTAFALSPDGRQIVFVASGEGASRLWLRSLATTTAQPLADTEGAQYPFWAPDGRAIGFFAGSALKRLDVVAGGGGAPQTLAPAVVAGGGTWNAEGVIVFGRGAGIPLMRVSATGGAAMAVTMIGPQQEFHLAPHFLPDGRRFLFYVRGGPDTAGIYLAALDGSVPIRLAPSDSTAVFLPAEASREGGPRGAEASSEGGWLLWVRAGTLVAQRLDVAQGALMGEPVTVADGVAISESLVTPGIGRSAVSVAATGLMAYRSGSGVSRRQLTWFDRAGRAVGTLGAADGGALRDVSVSPDGQRAAVARTVQGNSDIWLLDGTRTSRFTFDPRPERLPIWSPDGRRVAFLSGTSWTGGPAGPGETRTIRVKRADGAGPEEEVFQSPFLVGPTDWSRDGRWLLYQHGSEQTGNDLWVRPMDGDGQPWPVLQSKLPERIGRFSPDGRWVAYISGSGEGSGPEIYVRPVVAPAGPGRTTDARTGQWQISTGGGLHPLWRADGRELFYIGPNGEMMAVPMTAQGEALEPGTPMVLFRTRIFRGGVDRRQGRQYDVSRDGRFLINTVLEETVAPITLIQNWHPDAKK